MPVYFFLIPVFFSEKYSTIFFWKIQKINFLSTNYQDLQKARISNFDCKKHVVGGTDIARIYGCVLVSQLLMLIRECFASATACISTVLSVYHILPLSYFMLAYNFSDF